MMVNGKKVTLKNLRLALMESKFYELQVEEEFNGFEIR